MSGRKRKWSEMDQYNRPWTRLHGIVRPGFSVGTILPLQPPPSQFRQQCRPVNPRFVQPAQGCQPWRPQDALTATEQENPWPAQHVEQGIGGESFVPYNSADNSPQTFSTASYGPSSRGQYVSVGYTEQQTYFHDQQSQQSHSRYPQGPLPPQMSGQPQFRFPINIQQQTTFQRHQSDFCNYNPHNLHPSNQPLGSVNPTLPQQTFFYEEQTHPDRSHQQHRLRSQSQTCTETGQHHHAFQEEQYHLGRSQQHHQPHHYPHQLYHKPNSSRRACAPDSRIGSSSTSSSDLSEGSAKGSNVGHSAREPRDMTAPPKTDKKRHRRRNKPEPDPGKGNSEEGVPLEGKEKYTKEMIDSVRRRFSDLHSQLQFVPPLRFYKTKYTKLKHYSMHRYHVLEQTPTDPSALIGDLTEDVVRRCVSHVVESTGEPMFVMLNYQFDCYLFELVRKTASKETRKGSDTNEPDSSVESVSEDAQAESSRESKRKMSVFHSGQGGEKTFPGSEGIHAEPDTPQEESCANTKSRSPDIPFPMPKDLGENFKRGDFDILIVSRKLGLIVFEAKTMRGPHQPDNQGHETSQNQRAEDNQGDQGQCAKHERLLFQEENQDADLKSKQAASGASGSNKDSQKETASLSEGSEPEITDEDVRKTILKGLGQLKKAKTVLFHLLSDLPEQPTVTTVLALPHVSRRRLERLADDSEIQDEFAVVFGTSTVAGSHSRCLCVEESAALSEQHADDAESYGTDTALLQWWEDLTRDIRAMKKNEDMQSERQPHVQPRPQPSGSESDEMEIFSKETYETIIARFCGCYSRLREATAGDCVNLTGVCFGRSILREEQLNLISSDQDRFVFIIGPPGTGKTLLLGLKAADWALDGYHVIIVCVKGVNWGSLVSWTLYDRVKERVQCACRELARKRRSGSKLASKTEAGDGDKKTQDDTKTEEKKTEEGKSTEGEKKTRNKGKLEDTETMTLREGEDVTLQEGKTLQGQMTQEGRQTEGGKKVRKTKGPSGDRDRRSDIPSNYEVELGNDKTRNPLEYWNTAENTNIPHGTKRRPESSDASEASTSSHRPEDDTESDVDYTSFVNRQFICAETDISKFVTEMLTKYTGRKGLKFILDECPRKSTDDDQKKKLSECEQNLHHIVVLYEKLLHTASTREDTAAPRGMGPLSREEGLQRTAASSARPERSYWPQDTQNSWNNPDFSMEQDSPSGHRKEKEKFKKKRKNPNTKKRSDPDCQATPEPDDNLSYHFSSMDERLGFLSDRLARLQAATDSPEFRSADYWEGSIRKLKRLTEEVTGWRQKVEDPVLKSAKRGQEHAALGIVLEIDKKMVFALGSLYFAYNNLSFFVVDRLCAAIRRRQEEDESWNISLWSSSTCPNYCPAGFQVRTLDQILRCPPTVQEVLMLTEKDLQYPSSYTYITRGCDANPPLPSDGPEVKWIDHAPHMTSVEEKEVTDCPRCAEDLADYLLNTLRVEIARGRKITHKDCLQLHDVIISGALIHKPNCTFVKVLRARGITLEYERQDLTSPPPYPGKAFIIGGGSAQGLEAKIVIYVPEIKRISDEKESSFCSASNPDSATEEFLDKGTTSTSPVSSGQETDPGVQRRREIMSLSTSGQGAEVDINKSARSRRLLLERRLRDLGFWNRQYLYHVAARSLSHLIVFHV